MFQLLTGTHAEFELAKRSAPAAMEKASNPSNWKLPFAWGSTEEVP
jgi:hypothetical protein